MAKNRKIACMTATRADYPRVKAVLQEIVRRPNLELELIVTGMHLLKDFGYTAGEIEKDGFAIAAKVPMYDGCDDSPYGMAKAAAQCSMGIADALKKIDPDIFLITVDRVETLAAAQTGALMNYPLAHIQGGEVTGTIDESIRHAVTKLSHIHFPAEKNAAERIRKMGEIAGNVYTVGCPYIDLILSQSYPDKHALGERYGFNANKPLMLFTQHAVTTEYGEGLNQILNTMKAIERFSYMEIVAICPNADAGGRALRDKIKNAAQFHFFYNIPDRDYLALMSHADVMVGNSSAAIREAPSFHLPAVNIGNRQQGRLRAANVIDVVQNVDAIVEAITKVLSDEEFKKQVAEVENPYGDGNAAVRIVDVLENIRIGKELIQKRITY